MVVLGIDKFIKKLDDRLHEKFDVEVRISNSQNYALWVHERLNVRHPVGMAKFLELAVTENLDELNKIIAEKYEETGDMEAALLKGGLFIQREAMKRTPVDTGALRNAFNVRSV